jgi:hypothetical protein
MWLGVSEGFTFFSKKAHPFSNCVTAMKLSQKIPRMIWPDPDAIPLATLLWYSSTSGAMVFQVSE